LDHSSNMARLPVTIISGFLGSGKTTLLKHILVQNNGLRIAVIMNDIGAISIDAQLVETSTKDILTLSNGCICCSSNDDLSEAIQSFLKQSKEIDYLIVETTGIADPLPVIKTFMRPEFRNIMRIDAVITLIDLENIAYLLEEEKIAQNQVKFADFILLNKSDLVQGERIRNAQALVWKYNPLARMMETVRSVVPISLLLDLNLHIEGSLLEEKTPSRHDCHHSCHHEGQAHDFISVSFTTSQLLDADKFQFFLQNLPSSIFRAKGFIKISEIKENYIFHLIAKRFTLEPIEGAVPAGNQLVFIGRGFDKDGLLSALNNCVVKDF
jgi:G3E family GTPase